MLQSTQFKCQHTVETCAQGKSRVQRCSPYAVLQKVSSAKELLSVFLHPPAPPVPSLPLQARDAGSYEAFKNIDLVITSPFKRCLQTSAQVVSVLGLEQGKWLADWRLSEVRYMKTLQGCAGGHVSTSCMPSWVAKTQGEVSVQTLGAKSVTLLSLQCILHVAELRLSCLFNVEGGFFLASWLHCPMMPK
jgi:hypothetical protein